METLFDSDRQFKIWRYLVSHGQLLFRSLPTDTEPTRVEVLFRNVYALKLTTQTDCLTIRQASDDEVAAIGSEVGISVSELGLAAFVLTSSTTTGFVVATDMSSTEDTGNYKTPSSLLIGA